MALIPRKIRELREALLTQLQDNAVEVKRIADLDVKSALGQEERELRARATTSLVYGRDRVKELESQIDDEIVKWSKHGAVEARAANRARVKLVHENVAQRHVSRAQALEQWRDLSVKLLAEYRADFMADSVTLEAAVRHLSDADPMQHARVIEHVAPQVRGNDTPFMTALHHALADISVAASTGRLVPRSPHRATSFTWVADQTVKGLDARLPAIHAAPDADLGTNPELVEETPAPDKWAETIKQAAVNEAARQADIRAYNERAVVSGKTDEFVELVRDGKQPSKKS